METFDNIIIGSGPSVYRLLLAMSQNSNPGKNLVVEKGAFGGTCPNAGCEPKIFLEGTIRTILTSRRLLGKGIEDPAKINWTKLIQRKKQLFAPFSANAQKTYESLGAQTLNGEAQFVDHRTIKVNRQLITGKRFIIATGHRPRQLSIPGSEYLLTNNDVFNMEHLPAKTAIIGGGYVGMEIAVLLAAAGSDVTMLLRSDRPLRAFYSKHVQQLVNEMQADLNIKFKFNTNVAKVENTSKGYAVTTADGQTTAYNAVVNASGRVPNIDSLNLAAAGVNFDSQGIIVDDHLATNIDNIYAMGDVVKKSIPALTPTAEFEGSYLGNYLSGKENAPIKYPVVGTAVFTFPEIAEAGVKVDEALKDDNYTVKDLNITQGDYLYAGTNDNSARLVLVFDKDRHLAGASEISQTAVDDINSLIPVMSLDLDPQVWKEKMIVAFPSLAYKIKSII